MFNAGSLAAPFRDLLEAFGRANPDVQIIQESAGSLESARKITELGRVPDVLGVADVNVMSALIVPTHATWYAGFARNAMVLAYSDRSRAADSITGENWHEVLRRPGVRVGRSDPALDPNGYRTLMVYQLAERHYGEPGLAGHLLEASPERYVRPKEADLVALVQAGELDYVWSYRSLASTVGLRFLQLPAEVDLSDPGRADWYSQAQVTLPGASMEGSDSVTISGEPILYGVTVLREAPDPDLGLRFIRFLFSEEGRAILERNGFLVPDEPFLAGQPPADLLPTPSASSTERDAQ